MIRWSLQRGFICIPKSSSGERIAENANIFDFDISDQDVKILVYMPQKWAIIFCDILISAEWFG